MTFSEKIFQLRTFRNMTQEELAQALRLSPSEIEQWESGKMPDPKDLSRVSKYFGIPVDQLMDDKERIVDIEGSEDHFCAACGEKVYPGEKICRCCGSPIKKLQDSDEVAADIRQKDKTDKALQWAKWTQRAFAVMFALVVLALNFVFIFLHQDLTKAIICDLLLTVAGWLMIPEFRVSFEKNSDNNCYFRDQNGKVVELSDEGVLFHKDKGSNQYSRFIPYTQIKGVALCKGEGIYNGYFSVTDDEYGIYVVPSSGQYYLNMVSEDPNTVFVSRGMYRYVKQMKKKVEEHINNSI